MFADKNVLDPLAEPDEIVPRVDQERAMSIETTFDPEWSTDAKAVVADESVSTAER